MLFKSFLRTPQPKRFNYTPRYHDPRKEALQELVDRVKAEQEGKLPSRHQLKFERKYGVHQRERASNIRLVAIVVILSIIAFLIFS